MKKNINILSMSAMLMLILAACSPASVITNTATPEPEVILPVEPTKYSTREVQLVSVEVRYSNMNLLQPHVFVRGNLSGSWSCTTLIDPELNYTGNRINIKILESRLDDESCVQVMTPFEQGIPLDLTDLPAGTYEVEVNGVTTEFTIPMKPEVLPTPFQLVVYDPSHNIQVLDLNLPGFSLNPYFNEMITQGGSARGEAYVLDTTSSPKAVAIDVNGIHELSFIQIPTSYGLAAYHQSPDDEPLLAWGREYSQLDPSSALLIGAVDGSGVETLLTQEVTEPLLQLVALFWSTDGQWLYFSKEPVGLGGHILFWGASNLYRIDIHTKEVSEVIPIAPSDGPQVCLDTISKDYRYVADHCSENFIRIRDLDSGSSADILIPEDLSPGDKHLGSSRFSADGSRIAFAVAAGVADSVQGWVVVSDTAVSNSKAILTSQVGSYYTIAGWLNDQTLLVQSINSTDCSPYCASELWMVDINDPEPQKVGDGSFITVIPYGSIPTPLPSAAAAEGTILHMLRVDGIERAANVFSR